MTVSKTVYQGSNPCQPVLSMSVDKGKLTFLFVFTFINPLVIVGYQLPYKSSCHNGYWSRLLICRAKAHCRFDSYRGRSQRVCSSVGRAADFNKRLIINNLHEKDKPHGAIMRKLIIRMA